MNKYFYSLGLMSGTSMDGIDASIIKSDGEQNVEIIDDIYLKYDDQLRLELKNTIDSCLSKDDLKKSSNKIKDIEKKITLNHAQISKLIIEKNKNIKVDVIGFHGQTILHRPENGYSIQIGDSRLLAELTNTNVISNFRENDILNGGQGAPLAPIYHQVILKKIKLKNPSAIINIGGISNITYMNENEEINSFDMGPGNHLIDEWIKINTKMDFDKDGLIATKGQINEKILNEFLSNAFFKKKTPKSLDVRDFSLKNLHKLNITDGSATLSMLTVKSIGISINTLKNYPKTILISGGGRKNKFIIDNLKKILKCKINLIDEFSFNGDFIESQAFAYLAIRSYLNKFITFPNTTGVSKPCLGGNLFKS